MIIDEATQRKESRLRSEEGNSAESLGKYEYLRCELGRNRPISRPRTSS